MSRDLMRGIGYGLGIAGMSRALWEHNKLFIALWGLYGIWCLLSVQRQPDTTGGEP